MTGPLTQAKEQHGEDITRFVDNALQQTTHDLHLWQAIPQVQPLERQELVRAAQDNRSQDFLTQIRRAAPSLDMTEAMDVFNTVRLNVMQNLGHLLNGQANASAREGDATSLEFWLRQCAENGHAREMLGEAGAQAANLLESGRNLSGQQQEDMLRAALQAGFSYAAVRTAANSLGVQMPGEKAGEEVVQGALEAAAVQRAQDIMKRMRELYEESVHKDDPAARREYELERQKLSNLLGEGPTRRIEVLIKEQSRESDSAIIQAITAQIELVRRLHSGEENGVLPIAEGRRRAA